MANANDHTTTENTKETVRPSSQTETPHKISIN